MRVENAQGQTDGRAARVVSSPLVEILERVHREFGPDTAGRIATYIPELGQSDPRTFGIAVATVDGQVFDVGDARHTFTIQSISKPLVFGMALEECGKEVVLGRVGVEPSATRSTPSLSTPGAVGRSTRW